MAHSTKTAFCPLYFRAHGGRFDGRGNPLIDGTPGMCDRAFDCGTCSLLKDWVTEMHGWQVGWWCDKCLKETYWEDKDLGVRRWLPGFFQSGRHDDPGSSLNGCTRCGWESSFLQLIFRGSHG